MASTFCATSCYSATPPLSRPLPLISSNSRCQVQFNRQLGLSSRLKWGSAARNPRSHLQVLCIRDTKAAVITGNSWDKLILDSDSPVLVEFYARWCGPCQMVHRVIDEIATEYSGRLKCFTLDADNDLKIAETYDVKAVPVVLLFKNGEKRESVIGTMPKEFYVAAIERVLAL